MKKVDKLFGSSEKLIEPYTNGKLGSYFTIADYINKRMPEGIKISVRQVEKTITRNPNYKSRKSIPEMQLYKFIQSSFLNYEIIQEHTIPGTNKHIDIFINELNVGIEFNGNYWHSDEVILYNYGVLSEEFHKTRAEEANLVGIKLCYVWERD